MFALISCKNDQSFMKDFEDAVQADRSKAHFMNLILTRNVKDFVNSPVKALSPKDFIIQFNK